MRYEIAGRTHSMFFRRIDLMDKPMPQWLRQRLREYSIAVNPSRTKGVWSSL